MMTNRPESASKKWCVASNRWDKSGVSLFSPAARRKNFYNRRKFADRARSPEEQRHEAEETEPGLSEQAVGTVTDG